MDENVIAHAFHHNAFLIVSNGDRARYGSITSEWEHFSEWKRLDEADKGSLEAEVLLNGMLAHDRLLDIVENFILFDDSKPGATRKIIARNQQVLGVNRAVASVVRQEELRLEYPPERRLNHRVVELPLETRPPAESLPALAKVAEPTPPPYVTKRQMAIVERAHPDLGRLGVFWHTQGSGKSYSMAFFAEKVRRRLEGNFTFLLMTDRNDLDSQIYRTFVGCGIADDNTPRAASGDDLERLLKQNHRYVFSLIHKFRKDVDPNQPYSERDDIIVISDEAHRTQAGRLARNMRLALPNAAFIGFTGTPLFKQDEITKRIFGDYVSRYDFKRSEEDGATVKLVYENRGEKLGVARADLNDRIAEKIEEAELDPDEAALLEKLLGQDYEVVTADERLDKIAADFVEHCATRWQSGKSMLVCIFPRSDPLSAGIPPGGDRRHTRGIFARCAAPLISGNLRFWIRRCRVGLCLASCAGRDPGREVTQVVESRDRPVAVPGHHLGVDELHRGSGAELRAHFFDVPGLEGEGFAREEHEVDLAGERGTELDLGVAHLAAADTVPPHQGEHPRDVGRARDRHPGAAPDEVEHA